MPLEAGSSAATRSANIAELRRAGYPAKQAEAIAYSKSGERRGDALLPNRPAQYEGSKDPNEIERLLNQRKRDEADCNMIDAHAPFENQLDAAKSMLDALGSRIADAELNTARDAVTKRAQDSDIDRADGGPGSGPQPGAGSTHSPETKKKAREHAQKAYDLAKRRGESNEKAYQTAHMVHEAVLRDLS